MKTLRALAAAGEADEDDSLEAPPGMETRRFELNVGGVEVAGRSQADQSAAATVAAVAEQVQLAVLQLPQERLAVMELQMFIKLALV